MTEYGCGFCGLVTGDPCFNVTDAHDCPHQPGAVFKDGPLAGLRKWHNGVIYADPPWTYETWSDKGQEKGASQHYDVMDLEGIKALPVRDLAAKDCVLLMWVTDTHLFQARDVIHAWGFEYKTVGFYWAKQLRSGVAAVGDELPDDGYHFGMGKWTRANPEICLLATRGKPKRLSGSVRKLIVSPVREHSRKPDEVYDRIEQLVGGPYCELFSRTNRPRWSQMGNQTGLFSQLDPVEQAGIEELV